MNLQAIKTGLGKKIQARREKQGKTFYPFEKELGLRNFQMQGIEEGTSNYTVDLLLKYITALGLEIEIVPKGTLVELENQVDFLVKHSTHLVGSGITLPIYSPYFKARNLYPVYIEGEVIGICQKPIDGTYWRADIFANQVERVKALLDAGCRHFTTPKGIFFETEPQTAEERAKIELAISSEAFDEIKQGWIKETLTQLGKELDEKILSSLPKEN